MAKYGMAIDLKRCVGCGACAMACKTENNTAIEQDGKRFNWADFYVTTEGKFAHGNVKHWVFPTLCNHCTNAPCIQVCPSTPKALSKTGDGMTILNHDYCIGCGYCITHCPYSDHNVDTAQVQYSVISRNSAATDTHPFFNDTTSLIPNCTSNPAEVINLIGNTPPYANIYLHPSTMDIRRKGVSEKCTFCIHRVSDGKDPYCVVSCPSNARLFGDLDDAGDEIHQWMAKGYVRLKSNKGEVIPQNASSDIEPNVYYISYDTHVGIQEKPGKPSSSILGLFPNPARDQVRLELTEPLIPRAEVQVFDINGKEVLPAMKWEHLSKGKNTLTLQINHLKPGTYIVRVAGKEQQFTANLIKQ